MTAEESGTLLSELLEHATSAQYVHPHQWRQGDLVVWDNLAILHTASPCDSSRHHRLLYRTSLHQLPPPPRSLTPPDELRRDRDDGSEATPRVCP